MLSVSERVIDAPSNEGETGCGGDERGGRSEGLGGAGAASDSTTRTAEEKTVPTEYTAPVLQRGGERGGAHTRGESGGSSGECVIDRCGATHENRRQKREPAAAD